MRNAIGRKSPSFLADGLTTTSAQRIPQQRTAPLRLGGVVLTEVGVVGPRYGQERT
jgi:hypothetical protein